MSGIVRIYVGQIKGTVDREAANAEAAKVGLIEVTNLCRKIVSQATADAPVDTGFLRSQHGMTVDALRTKIRGRVVNRAKYAAAVHDGTRTTRSNPWLANAAERAAVSSGFRFQRTTVVSD